MWIGLFLKVENLWSNTCCITFSEVMHYLGYVLLGYDDICFLYVGTIQDARTQISFIFTSVTYEWFE